MDKNTYFPSQDPILKPEANIIPTLMALKDSGLSASTSYIIIAVFQRAIFRYISKRGNGGIITGTRICYDYL